MSQNSNTPTQFGPATPIKAINALEILDNRDAAHTYVPVDADMNISTTVEGVQVNTLLDTGARSLL